MNERKFDSSFEDRASEEEMDDHDDESGCAKYLDDGYENPEFENDEPNPLNLEAELYPHGVCGACGQPLNSSEECICDYFLDDEEQEEEADWDEEIYSALETFSFERFPFRLKEWELIHRTERHLITQELLEKLHNARQLRRVLRRLIIYALKDGIHPEYGQFDANLHRRTIRSVNSQTLRGILTDAEICELHEAIAPTKRAYLYVKSYLECNYAKDSSPAVSGDLLNESIPQLWLSVYYITNTYKDKLRDLVKRLVRNGASAEEGLYYLRLEERDERRLSENNLLSVVGRDLLSQWKSQVPPKERVSLHVFVREEFGTDQVPFDPTIPF